MTSIFAAAGLAEAAWAMDSCMLLLVMGVVVVVSLFALALRSSKLAVSAALFLLFATLFFQPWQCFSPFMEADYADPDVQAAAGMYQTAAVVWVAACVAVLGSLLVAFLWPPKGPPAAGTPHQGPERPGLP